MSRAGRAVAILAGVGLAAAASPFIVAAVVLHCCDDTRGPGPGAWLAMAGALLGVAAIAGLAVAAALRLAGRRRTRERR